jgi:hypothetical protein
MRAMIICAVLLAGCSESEASKQIALEAEAELMVQQKLKDPRSADFSAQRVDLATRTVCGQVNARNAFGGYVGNRGFIYADGTVILQDADPTFYVKALPICAPAVSRSG